MKVLHVLNELRSSGAERMLYCSAPYWRQAGVIGEILSTGTRVGTFASQMTETGYAIHHLPFAKNPWFFWRFYRLIKNGKYQIVHVHSDRGSFYYALIVRMAGMRFVRTIHSVFPLRGLVALGRSIQRNITKWIGGIQVSISGSVQETERKCLKNSTFLVENWYDNSHFVLPTEEQRRCAREHLEIDPDSFVVVSVGNCGTVKNHKAILAALQRLSALRNVLYLHLGEEEAGFPERKISHELGIADKVRFFGSVVDVLSFLHAADLFVMPSLWEGLPIAALEAMGAGVPVLMSDVPGLNDLKKVTGTFWVEPNPGPLADEIQKIASLSHEERRSIGQQLHLEANNRFSIKRGVTSYLRLYKGNLLERRQVY